MSNTAVDNLIRTNAVLAGRAQEEMAAQELRLSRAGASREPANTESDEQPQSLREAVMAAKRKKEEKGSGGVKDKLKDAASSLLKSATAGCLRFSWKALGGSFGLTLIYINTHLFLRWVFPDAFCKLGEEWLPKGVSNQPGAELASTTFGIVEVMGLLLIDVAVIFLIMGALSLISMIVNFMEASWWDEAKMILSLGWDGIKAFVDLFARL